MRHRIVVLLPLTLALFAVPAHACRVSNNQTPLLHEKLPPLGDGMIAAEVEIVTDVGSTFKPIETRVVRMIEGDFKGSTIRIEPTYWSSCDSLPYPGSRGILVGRVLSSTGDVLIVDPVRALSQRQLKEQSAAQTFVPH